MRACRVAALAVLLICAGPVVADGNGPGVNYMLHCQGCHLPGGIGHAGIVPNMRGEIGRFLEVQGGREFLIGVPGSAQSPLSDGALAEVLNWMVRAFGPAPAAAGFRPYSAAEVGLHRTPLTDVAAVRARLIERITARRGLTASAAAGPKGSR